MYRLKNRLAAAGAVLLAAMAFYLPAAAKDALVKEGVYVDGVALGGLDKWDAQWAVEDHVDELAASEAVLTFGDHTQQVPLSTFGLEWANQGIIDEIMSLGTGGNVISRYKDQKDIEHDSRNYSLEFSSSEKKIRTYVEEHPTSQYYIARKRVPYKDKLANCRLFANNKVQYYGTENDYTNLLTPDEVNTYAGYAGGNTTDFVLRDMEVEVEVGEGEDLTIGIKTGNQHNDAINALRMDRGQAWQNKDAIYNTAGLNLNNPQHGIYIVNGRKVAIR